MNGKTHRCKMDLLDKEKHILHFSFQSSALPANGYRSCELQFQDNRRGTESKLLHHHLFLFHPPLNDYLRDT